jgi:CheY-like chemotaxis protein
MPKMDGLEAARRIQTACPTPVVVVTAHESRDLVEKASEMGVSAYLTKPPSQGEIERAVTLAMARHGDLMNLRRLNRELEHQKEEMKKALSEIRTLRGLIPICSECKKIRNDEGYWEQVDVYLRKHSEARFSHGLCPRCQENTIAGM